MPDSFSAAEAEPRPTLVTLLGELDLSPGAVLRECFARIDGSIEVDCSGLDFVDAEGLGIFVTAQAQCQRTHAAFVLLEPTRSLLKLHRITALDPSRGPAQCGAISISRPSTPTAATEWPALISAHGAPARARARNRSSRRTSASRILLGDALRQEVDERTQPGLRVHPFLGAGRLVRDHFVFELIGARLACQGAPAVLLDGFPRTLAQAEMLEHVEPGAVALALLLAVPLPIAGASSVAGHADDDEYALRERLASFEQRRGRCWPGTKAAVFWPLSMPTDRRRM